MQRRLVLGTAAMIAGLLAAVAGKATGLWELGAIAVVALIGGGVAVALALRSATVRPLSTSRLSLLTSMATARAAPRRRAGGQGAESLALTAFAKRVDDALLSCERLLADLPPDPVRLDEARGRLMALVAKPDYGRALERRLVDEERVRVVSKGLAKLA